MKESTSQSSPSAAPTPPPRKQFFAVFPSIALPMFLATVDQTIVATALPAIAGTLGGIERIAWVVIAYLVATTISALIFGRLGDLLGRRRMLLVALAIFTSASLLCALSVSLDMLILMRVLQGLGGGGLMTLSQALIGEAMPPRQRAHYQGYLVAVAMTSTALGPVAGGFLTEHFGWPSVFFVSFPIGLLAIFLAFRLPIRPGSSEPFRFDVPGIALFAIFIAASLVALQPRQQLNANTVSALIGLGALALVSFCLLIWRERVARYPLIPLHLLRDPTIWRCDALAACHGARLVSLVTFTPIYLRVVFHASPVQIGLLLLPMTIGIGLGAMATARAISLTGRSAIFPSVGLIVVTVTLATFAFLSPSLTLVQAALLLGVTGPFMGTTMGVVQMSVQSAAGPSMLGAGAATVQVSRALGAALGTALVAAVLFATLAALDATAATYFEEILHSGADALAGVPEGQRAEVEHNVQNAFRNAFLVIAGFDAVALVLAWTLPLRRFE